LGLTLPDGAGVDEETAEDGLAADEDGLDADGLAATEEAFDEGDTAALEGFALLATTEADADVVIHDGRAPLMSKYARWAPVGIVEIGH
jgi:hypothetical protein